MENRADLERAMHQAAEAGDFERAAELRDRLRALGGASRFRRPVPGEPMGLGTDSQVMKPPDGWSRPKKPDMKTRNVRGRGKR